jgi:Tfp pilus assembly protein PilN
MQAVNLLPLDLRGERRATRVASVSPQRAQRIGGGALLVAVLLVAGLYFHARSNVSGKRSELADAKSQLANAEVKVQAIRVVNTQIQGRLTVMRSITGSRMVWDNTLTDLAKVLPGAVFLTSLQAAAPAGSSVSAAPEGTTFTVSGVAPATVRVADVLDRLSLLPWLSDVELTAVSRNQDGTAQFTATGNVVHAGTSVEGSGS